MYKRRVKRTVSASPVGNKSSAIPDPKLSRETRSFSGKSDISSSPCKENTNPAKEQTETRSVSQSRQKSSSARLQSDNAENSNTRKTDMRFATQDKQVPYFEKILSSCGLSLSEPEAHVLSEDQAIFLRDVKSKLEKSANFPQNVTGPNGFLQTFEEFCNDPENLKKSLQTTKAPDNNRVWKNGQDSLIHLLLSVDFLQKRLIEFLCEKLVEFVCSSEKDSESVKNYPWTQMILRQFKFLDHVVDPDAFLTLIFDVLSSVPEKGDVLFCLPDIIQDSQQEETAQRLSELLLKDWEMNSVTPSILDALTNLTLAPELQKSVSENVMQCLGSVQLDYLPNLVRFLVTVAIQNADEMIKIVSKFRQHLDFTSPLLSQTGRSTTGASSANAKGPSSVESCELLTVEVLKWSVMVSRPMAEAWLSAIKAVHSASRHQPLDVIMLLVLHADVPVARPSVQALFRNKARLGLFREKLLVTTFSTMLVVLKEYRTTLMEILFVLLKSPDPAVVDHASCWYKLCLMQLPTWQAQAVVQRLLLHVGTGSVATTRAALSVLAGLATEHLDTLLPHQWLLLNLLDKVPDVDANLVEMIMEVLCRVAFGSESHSGSAMDDNILMLARKQLASWCPEERKKGVISAILAAKHLASKEPSNAPNVEESIKQAIVLMELVTASTEYFPDATGLFLDKLSSVLCSVEVLDDAFLSWITNYIGKSFEEKYVVTRKGLTFEEDLKLMYNLEDPEEAEEEDDICIPLAHLVDRDCITKRSQYPPIVVMPASLRLVRCVKYLSCDGSLGDIGALLTCPVLLPSAVEQQDDVDFTCPQEQNFLLDCLFHCINWFRELISAFAYQKNKDLHRCVLLRLRDLVRLQKRLGCWLMQAIDYVPPPCQFFVTAKPPKPPKMKKPSKSKGKKRRKKSKKSKKKARMSDTSENAEGEEDVEEEDEEEAANEDEDVNDSSRDISVSKHSLSSDLTEYRGFLREMDVDVIILLTEPLILSPTEESVKGLIPEVFLFLLQDLTSKVEYLLAPEAKRISALKTAAAKPVGFANLETFAPRSFARNTIKLLPALIEKLELIGGYCQDLLDQSDNIRDAPSIFPENSSEIKLSYSYILRILAGLFNWTGFESKKNADYLRDALKLLVARDNKEAAEKDRVQGLLVDAATYLQSYVERTLVLAAACSLVKLLSALCHLTDGDAAVRKQMESACKTFLEQRWYTLKGSEEKGAEYNQHVDSLIKTYFTSITNKLETVSNLVTVVYQEVENCVKLGSKDWSLDTFPTITKNNFALLYRSLCLAVVQGLEEMLETSSNDGQRLKVWEVAIESLRGLMMIARLQNTRSNLIAFVKNSLRLLRTFLKRGLPLFGQSFRSRANQVNSILNTLQKSTRFLNSVCYHSKSTKDATLTSQVPALRLVLEQIVVSVRTMLAKNDCRDAFWIGVLKNRNLKGEEVLSQQNESTAEEEQEQEQDLPSDDDSDVDVDLDNPAEGGEEENDDVGSSISDVF